ncbi:MAG: ribose 5-phosphate isomerase B [Phycisphaeraceae bacterium]|nr:ribose 5-phosphate isomerase B [Phycisphaeraceae bacterium]
MKIAVGSDHRGYDAKEIVKSIVTQMGHEFVDMGTTDCQPMDYPDIAYCVATGVSRHEVDRGILVCSTGIGMCIAANKIDGVRAALCHDEFTAGVSRVHNDSNVLCFGADQSGEVMLRKMVETWLSSEFGAGRHERRVSKIQAIEEGLDPRES